ncbi:Auxin-responsive protein IAA14 [Heracleum sosnowskyi]|uniref:Auxin-responsive protein n=1 Tax=Heracleum sosnowskyi TaxID=360622 RepID=A0AAD8M5F0_9APIA|nr:Auxin-responsive protein IAA14 [Heracleum sosnowskyi]
MTTPLEHDYIGLSETPTAEISSESMSETKKNHVLNLKETELRLGLPGSVSPERKAGNVVPLFGKVLEDTKVGSFKNFASGAKRGFSDAIHASGKWAFSTKGGSEVDLAKASVKEAGVYTNTLKPVEENKRSPQTENAAAPASKAQVVGWPPIKSFRKNTLATSVSKNSDAVEGNSTSGCIYVKVSMDGAPYLRKVDLKTCCNYSELSSALEKMFSCFTIGQCTSKGLPEREGLSASRLMDLVHGSEYVLTYEDKDGDWMLVGDVPWNMFTDSCKRLRIMKGSEAIGLAPRAMEKCQSRH